MRAISIAVCATTCLLVASCGGGEPPAAGVPPVVVDGDGDSIPDEWERSGVDYEWADGTKHRLDMRALGASPTHKDIFVWVVWMEASGHTHRPNPASLEMVIKAFELARVPNPDRRQGINLHVVPAPAGIPEQAMLGGGNGDDYNWSEFDALKAKYFPKAFGDAVFYGLFAHDITEKQHSGIAKTIPGRDFIVSLAGFTNQVGGEFQQAGTFMHELGHALGLHHGGADDTGYKPNYMSVMNYFFQLDGLTINGDQGNFLYSSFTLDAKEAALTEKVGLSTKPELSTYGSFYFCRNDPDAKTIRKASGEPVDWNCDERLDQTVAADVNADGTVTDLRGSSDWDRVIFRRAPATAGVAAREVSGIRPRQELTPAAADRIPLFPVADVRAEQNGDDVVVRWQRVPLDRVLAYRVYRSVGGAESMVGTIENAPGATFVDAAPARGAIAYTVSAVFAPHAFRPVVPSVGRGPASTGVPPPRAGAPASAPFFNPITGGGAISTIMERAPSALWRMETEGVTGAAGGVIAELTRPPMLLETRRSEPAAVVVR